MEFIMKYEKLVCKIASKYSCYSNFEDLKQVGMIGLLKAVDKYIPNSIFTIISGHTNGVLCTVLSFVVVGILVMFLFYLIKYFFKAKKL